MSSDRTERVFASTTFEWKQVKIQAPPRPQGTARAKRAPLSPSQRETREQVAQGRRPATLQVKYRGGAECWWEFRYGGRTVRVSGAIYLHDAMRMVLELPLL